MRAFPERGRFVLTLDFSAFTSIGLGRSRSCNSRIALLTAETLRECLILCPKVQEVFLSEALEADIDIGVLKTLFVNLKHLKALDFCAADSPSFVDTFVSFLQENQSWTSRIRNLSLHNCSTLPTSFFESFLPHFVALERLDLYNTRVSGTALLNLNATCKLTVLNLSQCTRITALSLVDFVMTHPASQSLKTFSLLYSWNKTHPLSTAPQALDTFIQALPRGLAVLDLAGVELDLQHLSYLPPNLIELGAHDIDTGDHYTLPTMQTTATIGGSSSDESRHELHPMLKNLRYLLLTQTIISSEPKFSAILCTIFPRLAILECPGFIRLPFLCSLSFEKITGVGRRDWIRRRQSAISDDRLVEQSNGQFHPRKSNMSMTNGAARGIYDYYSYRV